jgi:clan AA aspartic protease
MGQTVVTAKIGRGKSATDVDFLVDSGATYTVLPKSVWKGMKLKPLEKLKFALADSSVITRDISEVWLEYGGRGRTVQVVLGENKDVALLGTLTLEALGLVLNPFNRELSPMKLMLATFSR